MSRQFQAIVPTLLALMAGFGYGRWFYHDRTTVAEARTSQRVLYYRCPMHPTVHSGAPGAAPCCKMAMVPVYEETAQPAGGIHVDTQQQQLIGVKFGKVEYTPVTRTIHAAARVALNEEKVARIQTKMEGWVDQVSVTAVGVSVHKGQQLLTVYNPRSLPAQQDFVRAMEGIPMVNPDPVPVTRQGSIIATRLRLELLGFTDSWIDSIEKTRQPMLKLPIHSPIAGTVIERNVLPKQKLSPETLYVIADLSTVWVIADVLEDGAVPGQAATLTLPFLPDAVFHGVVDSILPQADQNTRSIKVRLKFDNADGRLKPEMSGDVEIQTGAGRRVLSVPREAVLDSGVKQTVFVDLGNGYLEPRDVRAGLRFGDRIEISRGLKAGQTVVVSGNFLLDSESRLNR